MEVNVREIAIIGAGISGLATAHAIERLASAADLEVKVTVYEREQRAGGKIWSIKDAPERVSQNQANDSRTVRPTRGS